MGTRSLKALSESASTSRVLNLSRVNVLFKLSDGYLDRPFFNDPILNRAILVKHRLRFDETYLLPRSQPVATKIIFPFDATLLKSGGRSIFVGQTGFSETMTSFLGPSTPATRRDLDLLALLETLPSLDPFLLKEHLARQKYHPADCYFDISVADMARMRSYVSEQIGELISRALGGANNHDDKESTGKLVDALMAPDAGNRLDPLRLTLGLEGQAFNDGVFSWKGFLYYKWLFGETAKRLNRVVSELAFVRFDDNPSASAISELSKQQTQLRKSIRSTARECTAILTLYDDAFRDLLDKGKAAAFRKFLLEAPKLFIKLGSSMGTIAHIESYWGHRFPEGAAASIDSFDFGCILADFQQSLPPSVLP